MEFNTEIRKKQLENLSQFIEDSNSKIQAVLRSLDWTFESVIKDEVLATCPLNKAHKVPEKHLQKHLDKCSLKSNGYSSCDNFLSEPINNPTSSIKIEEQVLADILTDSKQNEDNKTETREAFPRTSDRLLSTYNATERSNIYDYVKEHTTGPAAPPEFNIVQTVSLHKKLTEEEMQILERDMKRRRAKYRSVHTNRKNQTEIMREVIDSQMEQYKGWLEESRNNGKNKETEEKKSEESTEEQTAKIKKSHVDDDKNHYNNKRHHNDSKYYRRSRERARSPYSRSNNYDRRHRK